MNGNHQWHDWNGLECCRVCGIVRRRDDKNTPCKGPTRVGPRGEAALREREIVLHCDKLDFDAIRQAMKRRQSLCSIPDGGGNLAGRLVAEICRGWMEMLDAAAGQEGDE